MGAIGTRDAHLEIRLAEVKRLMGMGARSAGPHRLDGRFRELLAVGQTLARPAAAWREVAVAGVSGGAVRLAGGTAFHGRRLAQAPGGAGQVVVFAVTIGGELEERVRRLKTEGDPLGAYVLDAVGSAAAEAAVERFQARYTAGLSERGLGTTLRFSPGYCDWDVAEQRAVFAVLGERTAGVRLLPSGILVPRKSVTGVFGVVPAGEGSPVPENPCRACPSRDCPTRRR